MDSSSIRWPHLILTSSVSISLDSSVSMVTRQAYDGLPRLGSTTVRWAKQQWKSSFRMPFASFITMWIMTNGLRSISQSRWQSIIRLSNRHVNNCCNNSTHPDNGNQKQSMLLGAGILLITVFRPILRSTHDFRTCRSAGEAGGGDRQIPEQYSRHPKLFGRRISRYARNGYFTHTITGNRRMEQQDFR